MHMRNQMAISSVAGPAPFFSKNVLIHLWFYYAATSTAYISVRNTTSSIAFKYIYIRSSKQSMLEQSELFQIQLELQKDNLYCQHLH